MPPTPHWPNDANGSRLHADLVLGTATASDAFASAYLEPLRRFLQCKFPHVSEEPCTSAAHEALLNLIEQPTRYDPARGSLSKFLCMSAKGDLRNSLAKESRARRKCISLELVEEAVYRGNSRAESDADAPSWDDPRLVVAVASFAPHERITYELLRAGERHTDVYARALGLDPRRSDLAAVVKRIKDNVKVRLRRAIGGRS